MGEDVGRRSIEMSVITELSNVVIPIIEDLCLDLAHAKNVIADLMRS